MACMARGMLAGQVPAADRDAEVAKTRVCDRQDVYARLQIYTTPSRPRKQAVGNPLLGFR